jgi:signal transduction histidine kinase
MVVAGVVAHIEGLSGLGRLERVRARDAVVRVAGGPADLVVVGGFPTGGRSSNLIARLKQDPSTDRVPVLHAEAGECECRADLCLPGAWTAEHLRRAARVLLERRRHAGARTFRLESLGRLAGGIVHDLNNILFALSGLVEGVRSELPPDHPARRRLARLDETIERGAELARLVLGFGRESTSSSPALDVNPVVARVERLVRTVLGERVRIETRLSEGIGVVRMDAGRMEQLVLNLVLNARDAMPRGGRVLVETRDVEIRGGLSPPAPPGRHVLLVVSDEGVGMDAATRARVFEPFFTTKGEGEGTGLGLAVAQSIVEAARGTITVDSAPGRGTTFRIYLPCVERGAEAAGRKAHPPSAGGETVVLVEGSASRGGVARQALASQGYSVLPASSAAEALGLLREHRGPVHLVVSGLAPPDLLAVSLARRAAAERPGVRVLFVDEPLDPERLARAVRDVLDRAHPA